jgi:hypothetical protein
MEEQKTNNFLCEAFSYLFKTAVQSGFEIPSLESSCAEEDHHSL